MMKILLPFFFYLTLFGQIFAHDPATEMTTAAQNLLNSLEAGKKKKTHFRLAERYFKFLGRRTKIIGEKDRKRLKFNIH